MCKSLKTQYYLLVKKAKYLAISNDKNTTCNTKLNSLIQSMNKWLEKPYNSLKLASESKKDITNKGLEILKLKK